MFDFTILQFFALRTKSMENELIKNVKNHEEIIKFTAIIPVTKNILFFFDSNLVLALRGKCRKLKLKKQLT